MNYHKEEFAVEAVVGDYPMAAGLPDKLSDLIDRALDDLEDMERDPKYVVDMLQFHRYFGDGTCHACLAGAEIRRLLPGDNIGGILVTEDIELFTKLSALDYIRRGNLAAAWVSVNGRCAINPLPDETLVTSYEQSPERFKEDLRAIARLYREVGE